MPSKPVDEEIRCLVNRLVDHTGPVWDGSAILRLKESEGLKRHSNRQDSLDDYYYKTLTFGPHYKATLTTSTIIRVLDALVSTDCFDEHDVSNDFALELHLRCVVSTLRVFKLYGRYNTSRHLSFDLIDKLYNCLAQWAQYHCRQAWKGARSKQKYSLENYNNEFLIIHARDLLTALSSERDLTVHAVSQLAAGIPLASPVILICSG